MALVTAGAVVAFCSVQGCSSGGMSTGTGGTMGAGGTTGGGGGTTAGTGGRAGTGGASVGTGGTTGTGGATAGTGGRAGSGGATGTDGGSSPGVCPGDKAPNPDVATSCNTANAKAGAACTQDCCITCGIDSLGAETCACSNDKYSTCDCPRPARWTTLGGECGDSACLTMGGPCMPQGYASSTGAPSGANILDGQDCVMNGNVCFTAEADGKHGCVCASTPSGDFIMRCGLVNGWFSNNGTATPY